MYREDDVVTIYSVYVGINASVIEHTKRRLLLTD